MRFERLQKPLDVAIWLLIVGGAATACIVAIASLRWEFEHDTPIIHYVGLLAVEFGRIPYRDIFDTSMPGPVAFHALLIWLFGPSENVLPAANLVLLLLVLVAGWLYLACIDRIAATAFVVWYVLSYFGGGPGSMLQRDFMAILPIAASMALVARRRPGKLPLRSFLCGLLFGVAALVKPQLALGAPLVILADVIIEVARPRARTYALAVGASIVGFALPIAATLAWLASESALGPFIEFVTRYLPLYVQQTELHAFLTPAERLKDILRSTLKFGSYWHTLPYALAAVAIALWLVRHERGKTSLVALAGLMALLYGLLPALGGQFWNYHYFPFVFFLIMTFSFLLLPLRNFAATPRLSVLCAVLLGLALNATLPTHFQLDRNEAKDGRVSRIVTALSAILKPGESVQPIDWTSGVIHAMLRLRIPIATRFLYDFQFYQNVDDPEIQMLRQRFIDDMQRTKPTYLVEATKRQRVSGIGTADNFPAFDRLVAERYHVVLQEEDFRILRRND